MLGIKIFDNTPQELINQILSLCVRDKLALELAIYNDQGLELINRLKDNQTFHTLPHKSFHLNYRLYAVNSIKEPERLEKFEMEMGFVKSLGIKDCVIHYQYANLPSTHLAEQTPEAVASNLKLLAEQARKHGVRMYIENTKIAKQGHTANQLASHRILWDTILKLDLQDCLGICLDWGHVKAFTAGESLNLWLDYTRSLKARGMRVYMHVHDNDGKKDLHLSLLESEEKKLQEHNHPQDEPFLDILHRVAKEFEDCSLILEYGSDLAIEHYEWTKARIQ